MPSPTVFATTRPCPISGSAEAYVVATRDRDGKSLRNVISARSGLIFVDPLPFEDTEEFYRTEYRLAYKGVREPKAKHVYRAGIGALKRLRRTRQYLEAAGRVLDAGSSSGEFLYLLRKRGILAEGIELNEGYAAFSREHLGVEVANTPFGDFETDRRFGAITMFHVLEHLSRPADDVRHLSGFLEDGGHFIVEVPNIAFPDKQFSRKWHAGHLYSFTRETLAAFFENLGFETVTCVEYKDGGNLFAVFRKTSTPTAPALPAIDPVSLLRRLHRQRRAFYLRPWNYFRIFGKAAVNLLETAKSRGKAAREILDGLYHESGK